jgi:glyoxylase-like metal-dependent hydrolase (beta-lactamase superfamily II)
MTTAELSDGITLIDTGLMRPRCAASYLVVQDGRGAFIETGTARNVDRLVAAANEAGLDAGDVDYVIVTHVHLDHAGGAGALVAELPNAELVVHPRGARHMIDPAKLIAGTLDIYGEEYFAAHYGKIVATPAERVIEAGDDHVLELSGRPLRFLDTPGHAKHHFCVWDEASRGVFAGDTFGIAYPELAGEDRPFIFPTTTPIQFDPETLKASIDRLVAFEPTWIYLTHFGRVGGVQELAADLRVGIDAAAELALGAPSKGRHAALSAGLERQLLGRLREQGCTLEVEAQKRLLQHDVELNTQGLEVWLDRREQSGGNTPAGGEG